MKLSVLIPTYNQDCTVLVESITVQLPADCEVIVADDGSTDAGIKARNRLIAKMDKCRLWEASKNMGRAAIRNRLAQMAQGDWLLFMDADAMICSPHFVQGYLERATAPKEVLCGGIRCMEKAPAGCELRWKYEHSRETRRGTNGSEETSNPLMQTFNFAIHRDLMLQNPFDERIQQYGHEDTLFGIRLHQKGIRISHFSNPLVHTGLDTNEDFLRKAEESLLSLYILKEELQDYSPLLRAHAKLRKNHLEGIARGCFRMVRRLLYLQLTSSTPCVPFLQLYKLGIYLQISAK